MEAIEAGPRHFAAPHPVEGRLIAGPPSIGKQAPIDAKAPCFFPGPAFFDDRTPPVDDGSKHIEEERLHAREQFRASGLRYVMVAGELALVRRGLVSGLK